MQTAASYANYSQSEYELICEAEALIETDGAIEANEWLGDRWPLTSPRCPPFVS